MRGKEKALDDLARVAGGTVNVLSGFHRQIKEELRSRADDAAHRMDLVPREDFERLELMLQEARKIIDEQDKRIEALEKKNKIKK